MHTEYIRISIHIHFETRCCRRLEKISWTDRVKNEEVLHGVNEHRKANWIGHILCRNCLLKQAI